MFVFESYLVTGGTLGGMMARWKYKGNNRPLTDVLPEMTKEQRDQLHEQCQPVLRDYIDDDFISMSRLMNNDGEFRERLVQSLKTFVTETMKLQLCVELLTRGKAE